ncbi:MAG: cysteine hydrolase family protein [Zavarzinia sp.]|nr:cysteine hydrolase family protein [Zavarzinia sp.]
MSVPPPSRIQLATRPEALTLAVGETALIVVDMQNAYASPGGYTDLAGFDIGGAAAVAGRIAATLSAARAAGMMVVYFQNGWDPAYREAGGPLSPNTLKSNALKTMRRRPELQGQLLARGGWDYELIDGLKPEPSDFVLPKTRYSGFTGTTLDSMLRSRGIRNLVLTGIATNVCVESTLRDAFFHEYFAVLLEDGCHQVGPRFVHDATVYNAETFFGWVTTTGDFTRALGLATTP